MIWLRCRGSVAVASVSYGSFLRCHRYDCYGARIGLVGGVFLRCHKTLAASETLGIQILEQGSASLALLRNAQPASVRGAARTAHLPEPTALSQPRKLFPSCPWRREAALPPGAWPGARASSARCWPPRRASPRPGRPRPLGRSASSRATSWTTAPSERPSRLGLTTAAAPRQHTATSRRGRHQG